MLNHKSINTRSFGVTIIAGQKALVQVWNPKNDTLFVNPTQTTAEKNGHEITFLYAVHAAYSGPKQFQYFVDTCHYDGLAVGLDIDCSTIIPKVDVPQSADLYLSRRLRMALVNETLRANRARSEMIQRNCVDNALMWFRNFHVDALRINGIHTLPDSAKIMQSIRDATSQLASSTGRQYHLLVD